MGIFDNFPEVENIADDMIDLNGRLDDELDKLELLIPRVSDKRISSKLNSYRSSVVNLSMFLETMHLMDVVK